MKSKVLLFLFVLILPNILTAQIQLGAHANIGVSRFVEKNNTQGSIEVVNYYTHLISFSGGADIFYWFKDTDFGLNSGINFSYFGSNKNLDENTVFPVEPYSLEQRVYSLSLPIRVNYKFEKWLYFNAGLANTFHVKESDNFKIENLNIYTLSFIGGFEFIIKDKIGIGAEYYRDIRPTIASLKGGLSPDVDIEYQIEQITLKISYLF